MRLLLRIRCLVIGHVWRVLRVNVSKHLGMVHLHTRAGMDADCVRCGAEWRDFYGHGITPDNERECLRFSRADAVPAFLLERPVRVVTR